MYIITGMIAQNADYLDKNNENQLSCAARRVVAGIVGDTLLSITALTIGILGLLCVLHGIPPAASYTLIGVSGLITLSWTVLACITKGDALLNAKNLLCAALSSNPS